MRVLVSGEPYLSSLMLISSTSTKNNNKDNDENSLIVSQFSIISSPNNKLKYFFFSNQSLLQLDFVFWDYKEKAPFLKSTNVVISTLSRWKH